MKLLLYAPGNGGTAERLESAITAAVSADQIETCCTITHLQRQLQQGTSDVAAIVLCAFEPMDLSEILTLADWLLDLRTVLLLPDRDGATLALGLTLRPRFISYLDMDFSDVTSVVSKMLAMHRQRSTEHRLQTPAPET